MNFKPKSVFLEENKSNIAIDAMFFYKKYACALRFWFDGSVHGFCGKTEKVFEKAMARAITGFVRERGGSFDIFPSEVGCALVCLDRQGFEKNLGDDGLLFLERESEKALSDYFDDNENIGDIVVEKIVVGN